MNASLTETALKNLRHAMTVFPAGTVVWSIASAERGVVFGWRVNAGGMVLLAVSWGARTDDQNLFEVSRTRVLKDEDEEDWQKDGGGSDATQS